MMDRRQALAVLTLALIAGGCTSGPRPLVPGEDSCEYCRMTIDDVRFGAMIITARGRIQTFDSIECLASYVASLSDREQPRAVYVANHEHPAQWLEAAQATYLHRSQLRSPMGRELAAFPQAVDRSGLVQRYGGATMAWNDVLTLVATPNNPTPAHSSHSARHAPSRAYGSRAH